MGASVTSRPPTRRQQGADRAAINVIVAGTYGYIRRERSARSTRPKKYKHVSSHTQPSALSRPDAACVLNIRSMVYGLFSGAQCATCVDVMAGFPGALGRGKGLNYGPFNDTNPLGAPLLTGVTWSCWMLQRATIFSHPRAPWCVVPGGWRPVGGWSRSEANGNRNAYCVNLNAR